VRRRRRAPRPLGKREAPRAGSRGELEADHQHRRLPKPVPGVLQGGSGTWFWTIVFGSAGAVQAGQSPPASRAQNAAPHARRRPRRGRIHRPRDALQTRRNAGARRPRSLQRTRRGRGAAGKAGRAAARRAGRRDPRAGGGRDPLLQHPGARGGVVGRGEGEGGALRGGLEG
ncbi:hypothetical protein DFJ74DRAFT_766472, partial [Hyaloraphidium curvatum]